MIEKVLSVNSSSESDYGLKILCNEASIELESNKNVNISRLGQCSSKDSLPLVLVVDDEPMNIEVMEMMLNNNNHSIDKALNGLEAIEKVKERLQ